MVRPMADSEIGIVDEIRAPYYARYGRTIDPIPEGTSWLVAEHNGKITACVGLLPDQTHGQIWALDLLGNAKGCVALRDTLQNTAKETGVTICGWVALDNKHLQNILKKGWKPVSVLVEYKGVVSSDLPHYQ